MTPQRESEPGRGLSWPDYHDTLNGWWDAMPLEIRDAYYNDGAVNTLLINCAKQRLTAEQMLWTLSSFLLKSREDWRKEAMQIIERSTLPPV